MRFADLKPGAVFRVDYRPLGERFGRNGDSGPFRKVDGERAVAVADARAAAFYVPGRALVIQVRGNGGRQAVRRARDGR